MPKKKLIWYPGAMYHVTSRGNRRNDIFKEEQDYIVYLDNIKEAVKYYDNNYKIISYCLMTNHVHIQIKTNDKHLWYLISRVNKSYARNFNNKYNYVGHLFQSRYNAELIEEDSYVLEASKYIHLNPVRANMVSNPQEYKWSSYNMYIGKEKEKLVNSEYILSYFKNKDRELYKKYIESSISSST
ncbi:transposase [Clostridium grantii]|uniref:REP element-mobilizing transposase RayT n=1 Tax=Clostridium grantii DSM 8605 TaxID=1121316 RepID=A0A1M5WX28_9CLOT|nr:transposase [Clostridium grantii]SHH91684.1 REP element-mobilizing transposase RayT [Clostridium grantii DSM 8605]